MYDIGISEIAVTAKYEDTEDTEDILKKGVNRFFCGIVAISRARSYIIIDP